eukprot:5504829-Prymnesium_polylepis.1
MHATRTGHVWSEYCEKMMEKMRMAQARGSASKRAAFCVAVGMLSRQANKDGRLQEEAAGEGVSLVNSGGCGGRGVPRENVGKVCGRPAEGEFEGKKYCGLHMRYITDEARSSSACGPPVG